MRRALRAIALVVSLAQLVVPLAPAIAAGAEENPYVESAGEALDDRVQIPWYDAEKDTLKPVELTDSWNWDLSATRTASAGAGGDAGRRVAGRADMVGRAQLAGSVSASVARRA